MPNHPTHRIVTAAECAAADHKPGGGNHRCCWICDGGLAVCAWCDECEAGLDTPCKNPARVCCFELTEKGRELAESLSEPANPFTLLCNGEIPAAYGDCLLCKADPCKCPDLGAGG